MELIGTIMAVELWTRVWIWELGKVRMVLLWLELLLEEVSKVRVSQMTCRWVARVLWSEIWIRNDWKKSTQERMIKREHQVMAISSLPYQSLSSSFDLSSWCSLFWVPIKTFTHLSACRFIPSWILLRLQSTHFSSSSTKSTKSTFVYTSIRIYQQFRQR